MNPPVLTIEDRTLARADLAALIGDDPVRLVGCTLDEAKLSDLDLTGWVFERCSLARTDLGKTELELARFLNCRGAFALFRGANLEDAAFRSSDFNNASFRGATLSSAFTPRWRSARAIRRALRSSSRYVIRRSPETRATASGVRRTWPWMTSGMVTSFG